MDTFGVVGDSPKREKLVSRTIAVLCWLLGFVLFIEAQLGRAILPWEEPDPTTESAALFVLFLGLLVWFAGDVAALRQRVEQLEHRMHTLEPLPGTSPDSAQEKPCEPK